LAKTGCPWTAAATRSAGITRAVRASSRARTDVGKEAGG
jgi:hypothetical protein